MRIRIVKYAKNEEDQQYEKYNLPNVKKVLKEFVIPWANTDRIVCADSYLTSVPSTEELCKHGLRFIGVIKKSTRKFTMAYLSNIEFQHRGDMSGLLTRTVERTNPVLIAFVWMYWNRR